MVVAGSSPVREMRNNDFSRFLLRRKLSWFATVRSWYKRWFKSTCRNLDLRIEPEINARCAVAKEVNARDYIVFVEQ